MTLRTRTLAAILLAAALWAACDGAEHAGLEVAARRGLADGRAAAAEWVRAVTPEEPAAPADLLPPDTAAEAGDDSGFEGVLAPTVPALDTTAVLAVGYLERLRLGLGSPFRLAELALTDPRLPTDARERLAWAILAGVVERRAYEIDAAALDRAGAPGVVAWPGLGERHLGLVEEMVRRAEDPRAGEMAVRLAYMLAQTEGRLPERAPRLATEAAALLRDRELARNDVLALLRHSAVTGEDPLQLLPRWRAAGRFAVEQPLAAPTPLAVEREALALVPDVLEELRELAREAVARAGVRPDSALVRPSLLAPAAAALLDELAAAWNAPPATPVAVSLRVGRRELLEFPGLSTAEAARREAWLEGGVNEERFVAGRASVRQSSPFDAGPSLVALAAAVALRPYAQEVVWHPGFPGAPARDLEERFGLAALRFDEKVPAAWHPYYRRMLASALADLTRVLPSLDFRGLRVHVTAPEGRAGTLALHEPRTRTLVLPPVTGGGTLAHELAHDLDWQVAVRRYRVRGDYASDRAVRLGNDRLAGWVQDLATASFDPAGPAELQAHAARPAENFARAVDRFVTGSLAASGRMNGYLSSIQDDVLTGYGTVRAPDISGAAGNALLTILGQVAPVHQDTRSWFLRVYGSQRSVTPQDLVRLVAEAPVPAAAAWAGGDGEAQLLEGAAVAAARLEAVEAARQAGQAAIDAWLCRAPGIAHDMALEAARRRLVDQVAAARARAVVVELAAEMAGRDGRRWAERRFYGGGRDGEVEESVAELLLPLVEQVRAQGAHPVAGPPATGFFMRPPRTCAPALVAPAPAR